MDSKIYNQAGEEAGKIKLPERIFGLPWNPDLVHQVVVTMQANARSGTAHTKDRGEVRGGGKKPWRQKGTGRARHGSIRSPIWRKGGVTHGPRAERNWSRKVNAKMRTKALLTVLSKKQRDEELLLVDSLSPQPAKTKTAFGILKNLAQIKGFEKLGFRRGNRALVALGRPEPALVRSFRNLPQVTVEEVRNLNPVSVLNYQYLILTEPQSAIEVLSARAR